ncbi:MAG: zinc ribbon domain-containing protein [Candidatus Spyradocola sp.]
METWLVLSLQSAVICAVTLLLRRDAVRKKPMPEKKAAVPAATPGKGSDAVLFCTQCGAQNKTGAAYCTRCGYALNAKPAPAFKPVPAFKSVPAEETKHGGTDGFSLPDDL